MLSIAFDVFLWVILLKCFVMLGNNKELFDII